MRILFVVHRFGAEIHGGAEVACRLFALQLAARGHEVQVVTSCARDYTDWSDHYPSGSTRDGNVLVHRLSVARPRDLAAFNALSEQVLADPRCTPLDRQRQWLRAQGPELPTLPAWLAEHGPAVDVVVPFTYLYSPASVAITTLAGRVPLVFHPCAHEERPLELSVFDLPFHLVDAFGFFTQEELDLVTGRFGVSTPSAVVGIGLDPDAATQYADDGRAARETYGLGQDYLACVGRVDRSKGVVELAEMYRAYRSRRRCDFELVFAGEIVHPIPEGGGIRVLGPVPEPMRQSLVSGASLVIQPSYFESFAMVLTEAWILGVPALVQGRCDVLVGQALRAGAGVPYRGYAEFEAALDRLLSDEPLRQLMGRSGRQHVLATYAWRELLPRYEELLASAINQRRR